MKGSTHHCVRSKKFPGALIEYFIPMSMYQGPLTRIATPDLAVNPGAKRNRLSDRQ